MVAAVEAQYAAVDHDVLQNVDNQHGKLGRVVKAVRKGDMSGQPRVEVFFPLEQRLGPEQAGRDTDHPDAERTQFAGGRKIMLTTPPLEAA